MQINVYTLSSSNAGEFDVVFEHDEGDQKKIEVGAMRGKQHSWPLLDNLMQLQKKITSMLTSDTLKK